MTIRLSPTTKGFYDSDIHKKMIPSDAIEISAALHKELLDAQAKGHSIDVDEAGHPVVALPAPAATRAQLQRKIKREARRRIERVAPLWRQLNDLRSDTEDARTRFAQIDAIRSASYKVEGELTATPDAALDGFDVASNSSWTAAD